MKRSIDATRVLELLRLRIPLSREERVSIVFVQPPEVPLVSCLPHTAVLLSRNQSHLSRDSRARLLGLTWMWPVSRSCSSTPQTSLHLVCTGFST